MFICTLQALNTIRTIVVFARRTCAFKIFACSRICTGTVRGAGRYSEVLFPMLDRPHLSNIPMLRRKHQLVDVFKAKWALSDSSLEYWNNEILTYWNIRSLRIIQTLPKPCKTYYVQCNATTCLTKHRSGTPDPWAKRVPSALSFPWVFIAVIMSFFPKSKVRLRNVSGTGRKKV